MGIRNQGRRRCVPLCVIACGLWLATGAAPDPRRARDGKATGRDDRPNPYPGCVRIFDGRTFDGWEADPSTWSIANGAMRGSGGSSRLAYTKADHGNFRLIFTSRMAPVNGDHLGVFFWGIGRPTGPGSRSTTPAGSSSCRPSGGCGIITRRSTGICRTRRSRRGPGTPTDGTRRRCSATSAGGRCGRRSMASRSSAIGTRPSPSGSIPRGGSWRPHRDVPPRGRGVGI